MLDSRQHPNGLVDYTGGRVLVRVPRVAPELKNVGGSWDARLGAWRFPGYAMYVQSVVDMFPKIDLTRTATQLLDGQIGHTEAVKRIFAETPLANVVWEKLYPYQRDAVAWLYGASYGYGKPGSLLALSPGLGKTAVSMFAARFVFDFQYVLVISPLSLLATWERESRKWAGRQLTRTYGTGPGTDTWVVTNYDTVVRRKEYIARKWDLVILDESILVKNRDTLRFKTMKALRINSEHTWLLSGNPVSRYADDLWAQFHLIDPPAFKSYWRFTERYCHLEETNWGVNIVASREDRDMLRDLHDVMFVRNQSEVLPDLPEYIAEEVIVELTPTQQRAHDQLKTEFLTTLDTGEEIRADIKLAQLLRLQEVTSSLANLRGEYIDISTEADLAKGKHVYEESPALTDSAKHDAIVEMLEAGSFELPCIVWAHWRAGALQLYRRLKKTFPDLRVALVQGGAKEGDNERLLKEFVDGELDLIILSLGVGKFGLTMTNTRTVIYLDKTWNADDYVQSLRRVQRIGLDHRPYLITLKAAGTVDELVEMNLAGKMVSISQATNADLRQLLEGLGR